MSGVVGANGAGKSTLLRLLAGAVAPQQGTLTLSPSDAFVGWLPQEHERVPGESVADCVARRTGCAQASAALDVTATALEHEAAPGAPDPADVYAAALDRWLASGASDLEERLPVVLAELGLPIGPGDADRVLMTSLSGGQAARVGLAALLLSRFDLVLLDEPTNDLDLPAIEQLEQALESYTGTLLLVTHDRRMLETVRTDRRWHVEGGQVVEL